MKKLLLTLLVALLLAGCQAKSVPGKTVAVRAGTYRSLLPAELHSMLKHKDFLLVNVHVPFAGNIAGTDLSIPYDRMAQDSASLPAEKDAPIVLYCRSGRMSEIAAEQLVDLGYTNVWSLSGGMLDWEAAGFNLESAD